MSDIDLDLPSRDPPLDSVLDGYYTASQYADKSKLTAIKNVMKSAISITKSKTGRVILKTNRLEGARLKGKVNIVKKERTFAEVDLNKSKIVFKAQYGKWMNLKNLQPIEIKDIKSRYKQVRKQMKKRETAKLKPKVKDTNSKWAKVPLGPIPVTLNNPPVQKEESGQETATSSTEQIDTQKKSSFWDSVYWGTRWDVKRPKTPQEKYPYSCPKKETVNRNGSRQMKRRAALWREETFDMSNIRDLLEDQHLKQESLYCKQRIDRWKTQMIERQKTIDEELKLTVTQRQKTPASITSDDDSDSDVSSTAGQRTIFPDLRHKQTPAYAAMNKDHPAKAAYQNKAVTFYGREVVSMNEEKRSRLKHQSSASLSVDFGKLLTGGGSGRSEKRQGTRLSLQDIKGKTMLL